MLLVIGLLGVPAAGDATTLIVLEREGAIYLGADSWRSKAFANQPTGDFVCKIRRYGDVLVAAAGFADNLDPKVGLDFVGAFTKVSQQWSGRGIDEKADMLARAAQDLIAGLIQGRLDDAAELQRNSERLARVVAPTEEVVRLRNQVERLRTLNAELLATLERGGQQIITVNIDGERPRAAIRAIAAAHVGQTAAPRVTSEPFAGFNIRALDSAYRKMAVDARNALFALGPQAILKTLIEAQAIDTPTLVRLPANIVKIAVSGHEWLEYGDACKTLHGLR